jgi:hypothetical protein
MSRPTQDPEWATDAAADIKIPTSGKKLLGWKSAERPPGQTLNWWQNLVYQWVAFFAAISSGARAWWVENWRFDTAYLDTHGWQASGPCAKTTEDPIAALPRRFLKFAQDTGVVTNICQGKYLHYFTDTSDVDLEFDVMIPSYGTSPTYEYEVGINFSAALTTHRVVVKKTTSSANWYLQVFTAGGSATDSGIVANAGQLYRVKLEYRGNAGSDSTARLWIDGALCATITDAEVPINDIGKIYIKQAGSTGATTVNELYVGTLSFGVA